MRILEFKPPNITTNIAFFNPNSKNLFTFASVVSYLIKTPGGIPPGVFGLRLFQVFKIFLVYESISSSPSDLVPSVIISSVYDYDFFSVT